VAVRSYDGPLLEEKALLRAAEGGLSSAEYVDLCRWLADGLKPLCELEESLTSGPGDIAFYFDVFEGVTVHYKYIFFFRTFLSNS